MLCLSSSFLTPAPPHSDLADLRIRELLDFDVPAIGIAHPHGADEEAAWVRAVRGTNRRVAWCRGGWVRSDQELIRGQWRRPRLCALDESERRAAVLEAEQGMAQADRLEAAVLSLWAGDLDLPFPDREILESFGAGRWRSGRQWHDGEAERQARRLATARDRAVPGHLDALRKSLDAVLSRADRQGAHIVLEPRFSPYELPSTAELIALRDEFEGSSLRCWLDLAREDRLDRLGFSSLAETKTALADHLSGITLSDGVGLADGLPPGHGQIPFKQLLYGLVELEPETMPARPWVLRMAPGTGRAAIQAGLNWVRDSGLDGPPRDDADPFPTIGG